MYFEKICRVCLEEENKLYSIVSWNFECGDLCQIIQDVSGVVIDKTELKLPLKICKSCIERATVAQKFRKQCIESDQFLKSFHQNEIPDFGGIKVEGEKIKVEVDIGEIKIEDELNDDGAAMSEHSTSIFVRPLETAFSPGKVESDGEAFDEIPDDDDDDNVVLEDGKIRYRCSICKVPLKSKAGLMSHEKSHERDEEFGKSCIPGKQRTKSKATNPPGTVFECSYCGIILKNRGGLVSHEQCHLRNHARAESGIRRRRRRKERLVISDEESQDSQEKLRRSKNNPNFECSICGIVLKSHIGLISHEKSHERDKEFGYFAAPGVRRWYKKKRVITDKNDPNYWQEFQQCSTCGKSYRKEYILTHEKKHHVVRKEKTLICDYCGKMFSEKAYVLKHIEIKHLRILRFKCHLCDKSFGVKEGLKSHLDGHIGVKKYQCHLCAKGFTRSMNLKQHLRVHTGERPYKCEYCDKAYMHVTDRMRHMISHTGKYPYNCKICSKGFERPSKLRDHEKIHGI